MLGKVILLLTEEMGEVPETLQKEVSGVKLSLKLMTMERKYPDRQRLLGRWFCFKAIVRI